MAKLCIRLIFTTLALVTLGSCEQKKQHTNYESADGYNKADSIISAISDERDWPKFLATCDSFQQTGDISRVKGSPVNSCVYPYIIDSL